MEEERCDAMRCDTDTARGEVPQCCSSVCSSLGGQATRPRCSSATTDSASFRASSGRPSTGGARGGGRETGARDGRETMEGFQFAAWGLGEWGGGMIPMIGELVPPDCIIRCLKWLAPLPLLCFLGRRATTTRPQFDMAIDRPRLPSTNTARSGRDLGRGRGRGYTQSTWNL